MKTNMTDRELLELAAKASGEIRLVPYRQEWLEPEDVDAWNPLKYDGDALRLAVKLHINLEFEAWEVVANTCYEPSAEAIEQTSLSYGLAEATRRAIVRVAAEIGKESHEEAGN